MNISYKVSLNLLNCMRYFKHLLIALKKTLKGDVFANPGCISDGDFEQIKLGIEEVKPEMFIEIGTSDGYSAKKIFGYLKANYPECCFYTLDVCKACYENAMKFFPDDSTFRPQFGLSVLKQETTLSACTKLTFYSGPSDVLRTIFKDGVKPNKVDIAFIDSAVGTALAELLVLEKKLSANGIIFCHDVLNKGKGVEVLGYLQKHPDKYIFEVINTGPMGMIKIKLKANHS